MPQGASITGISSMATRAVLAELGRAYEIRSGCGVAIESVGGVDAAARVQVGEPFDVVVLARDAIDRLLSAGHLVAGSAVDLARSAVAIAVRAGAARPDVGSEDALRRTVLGARTIGASTGPSGVELKRLFERWGIADEIKPRIVQAPPGVPVGTLVARGERMGLIRFGSRTDVYLPADRAEARVAVGDKVIGGGSVIARWL